MYKVGSPNDSKVGGHITTITNYGLWCLWATIVTRDYQLTLTSGGPAVRAKVQDFEGEISRGAISEQDLGKNGCTYGPKYIKIPIIQSGAPKIAKLGFT